MKNPWRFRDARFLVVTILTSALFFGAHRAKGQTFNGLFRFAITNGSYPYSQLARVGNRLFGTTYSGGVGLGQVFAINADGSGFATLHSFSYVPHETNYDGASPYGGLASSGDVIYGTTTIGGANGAGVVFSIHTDGTDFTTLHSFAFLDGVKPYGALILSGNRLYGTTTMGGNTNNGTVFALNTDGSDFTVVHSFAGGSDTAGNITYTNAEGSRPSAGLALSNGRLYGVATGAGPYGGGTIFAVNTDGSGFATLFAFNVNTGPAPQTSLVVAGDTLFGGSALDLFSIKTNGADFSFLHLFNPKIEGSGPNGPLAMVGNTLFGTTQAGGKYDDGVLFSVGTNGSNFTVLHTFNGTDGANTVAGLIQSGRVFYGVSGAGGGFGTVFALTVPPTLDFQTAGGTVALSWDDPSFGLQAAPAISGPWAPVANSSSPFSVSTAGKEQFFRLVNATDSPIPGRESTASQ